MLFRSLCAKKNQKHLRDLVAFNVNESKKEIEGYCQWCEHSNDGLVEHFRKAGYTVTAVD